MSKLFNKALFFLLLGLGAFCTVKLIGQDNHFPEYQEFHDETYAHEGHLDNYPPEGFFHNFMNEGFVTEMHQEGFFNDMHHLHEEFTAPSH